MPQKEESGDADSADELRCEIISAFVLCYDCVLDKNADDAEGADERRGTTDFHG